MRTLFVTIDPAFPPVSGAELRNWQNAVAASLQGPVFLASAGHPTCRTPHPAITCGHLPGIEPWVMWESEFNPAFPLVFLGALQKWVKSFQPDVIVLEFLMFAKLASFAKQMARTVVIDFHNIQSDLLLQEAEGTTDAGTILTLEKRAARLRDFERHAARFVDGIWVCSAMDQQRLMQTGVGVDKIHIVPNGIPFVEEISYLPRSPARGSAPVLLFAGHLSYPPNVEAAQRLIEIMPAIWEETPRARLILAGRDPAAVLSKKTYGGKIEVIANPHSMGKLLSDASIAVMPLRRGGGTRFKVLEAMAWGVPVVATRRAVEGLALDDGVHVCLAETDSEFVEAIRKLLADANSYEAQCDAAQKQVEAFYGTQAINAAVKMGLIKFSDPRNP